MPKELTHWILAERALAGLDTGSRTKGIILAHRELYLAGAVLPDTLMHLLRGPDSALALAMAHRFHDAGDNSYTPLIRIEQGFPDGPPEWLLACLLGVFAHMQADIIFHPFVFGVAGRNNIGQHYRMETAIDVYLKRKSSIAPTRHLRSIVTPGIRDKLMAAGSLLFDHNNELQPSSMGKAIDLHCRIQSKYDQIFWKLIARTLGNWPGSPLKGKHHLFYPLDISSADSMLIDSGSWLHPVTGRRHTTTVDELADQAILRTIVTFKNFEQQGSLASILASTPGENLLTGIHGVRQKDMKTSSIATL